MPKSVPPPSTPDTAPQRADLEALRVPSSVRASRPWRVLALAALVPIAFLALIWWVEAQMAPETFDQIVKTWGAVGLVGASVLGIGHATMQWRKHERLLAVLTAGLALCYLTWCVAYLGTLL